MENSSAWYKLHSGSLVQQTSECFDSNKAVEMVLRFHGDMRGGSRSYSRLWLIRRNISPIPSLVWLRLLAQG